MPERVVYSTQEGVSEEEGFKPAIDKGVIFFERGLVLGLCAAFLVTLINFGLFYALEFINMMSRSYAVWGLYLVGALSQRVMLRFGFEYTQKEEVTMYESTVEYPYRPLLALVLISGGIFLLLLLIFVVPETLLGLL